MEPPQTGYCRRGVVELLEGSALDDALAVIERSCSLAGTAHRIALCQAVEAATAAQVSAEARLTRVLFAEVERIQARLWLLAMVSRGMGQLATLRDALEQREALFDALEAATGHRHYGGVALPGGVRSDLALDALFAALAQAASALEVWQSAVSPTGPLGRAGAQMGSLSAERATALALTGLSAAGSGVGHDVRREAPTGGYQDLSCEWNDPAEDAIGDVASRLRAAVEDIAISLALSLATKDALANSPRLDATVPQLKAPAAPTAGEARIEGPHGPVHLALAVTPALTLTNVRLETPGAALLAALPELLEGRLISQAPAILASVDLCMECLDQ